MLDKTLWSNSISEWKYYCRVFMALPPRVFTHFVLRVLFRKKQLQYFDFLLLYCLLASLGTSRGQ